VVCGDDVTQGRPAPYLIFRAMEATGASSVHSVANVGDTTLDLQAGHNAGVRWNVGVLSGAHDRQALERAPHTHLLLSVAELTGLWPAA
jgi:phosphoglycolate phosphatase-like HAD superfamily hydrolase